jgi:methionyl-tRNA formyltransferase
MRVMIVGQRWLAAEVLALCIERGDAVVAVAAPSRLDRLGAAATVAGIPVVEVVDALLVDHVPAGVDVIVCAHAHAFVTAGARAAARLGALGYHPSLLPRHRGRDAIRWAIHMKEDITGGTVYWMTDKADAGPVAMQEWCFIRPEDGPDSLWRRELGPMGVRLFGRVLADLDAGKVIAREQDEGMATWEPSWSRRSLAQGAGGL